MNTATTASAPSPTDRPDRSAPARRVLGLARANLTLLLRNKLTAGYALVLPLLPLALMLAERGEDSLAATAMGSAVLMALLFPVFYNLLSATVTRRDELVLKRMRTGEVTDAEQLTALALPGAGIAGVLAVIIVPLAVALGAPVPENPVLYLLAALLGIVLFSAFALWTAAWTRNAEAAQMTSLPVILLAVVGQLGAVLPDGAGRIVDLTPGAAIDDLLRIGWFGMDGETALSLAETWGASVAPGTTMVAWTALALVLARRSMRWEPRH